MEKRLDAAGDMGKKNREDIARVEKKMEKLEEKLEKRVTKEMGQCTRSCKRQRPNNCM